jgi:hypothetical protein
MAAFPIVPAPAIISEKSMRWSHQHGGEIALGYKILSGVLAFVCMPQTNTDGYD